MVLTCDVSTCAGLDRYRKTYPDKYLDLGIAEQNMIGVAAGLASEGYKVVTTTFAPFQTIRCCEQIKVNIGYMKQKICMVGIGSGLALGLLVAKIVFAASFIIFSSNRSNFIGIILLLYFLVNLPIFTSNSSLIFLTQAKMSAPFSEKVFNISLPMPLLQPVIMAVLFFRSILNKIFFWKNILR